MIHYYFLRAWATSRTTTQRVHSEKGNVTTETVIILAIMAGLALAAGAIIVAKVMTKANDISLN